MHSHRERGTTESNPVGETIGLRAQPMSDNQVSTDWSAKQEPQPLSLHYDFIFVWRAQEGWGWAGGGTGRLWREEGYFFEGLLEVWQACGPLNTRGPEMTDRWAVRAGRVCFGRLGNLYLVIWGHLNHSKNNNNLKKKPHWGTHLYDHKCIVSFKKKKRLSHFPKELTTV